MESQVFTFTSFKELQSLIKGSVQEALAEHGDAISKPAQSETYLSKKEVADKFNVTTETVHQWTKKGRIPAYRIEGRVFYKLSEIEESMTKIGKYKK